MAPLPTIAILGASGLIGEALARYLQAEGYPVLALARRFTPAQRQALRRPVETPLVEASAADLSRLLDAEGVEIVVNCIGVLQDSGKGRARAVHRDFAARLVEATRTRLFVQISIPGREAEDRTGFSTTKREAEHLIAQQAVSFAILRPGFVWAPAAYGGSALIRALAMLPFALPAREAASPFAATDVRDIARTVAFLAHRWAEGERDWRVTWDVMERRPGTVETVVEAVRLHLGGPPARLRLPGFLMMAGARLGDLAARLGWSPPIRTTALMEMQRGVSGDPGAWMEATGLQPASLLDALSGTPATVQERWFARLYLLKALVFTMLVLFWLVSGLVALTISFEAATAILIGLGLPVGLAKGATVLTSLLDIQIGTMIATRRTARLGLWAAIALSLAYVLGAILFDPDLWLDPLGSMVKTLPAIVLALVALALLDER
ncbi:SDR family oxidoreductase [Aureimonas sp. N4]|uniref:SDR family oxidoreductase n=1 Tax=Aureimonas sp. N4 TaxID=1638165 RepID=UPI0007817858|nr:SDR family oxidoreductase [Aureimonas sp. N4]